MTDAVPWSPEAELGVLAAMLIDVDAIHEARRLVDELDFHRDANRRIYRALVDLADAGGGNDVISVANRLRETGELESAGGFDYLGQIIDAIPTSSQVRHHARIVHEKAQRRRLIAACQETARQAMDADDATELFSEAERRLLEATSRRGPGGFRHVGQAVIDAMATVERAAATADGITGIRTGIPKLDYLTTGLEEGGLTVIAGRPAMGKSALGWQLAERAAMDEHGVCVASYEMADAQLGRRGLVRLSHVDASTLRRGQLDGLQWRALADAGTTLGKLPIWTCDQPPHQVEGLRSLVHRHLRQHPETRLAVVDYLQQMSGPKGAGNRNNEVEHISRGLKRMAMELGIHVVALAQLNRGVEHRSPPRPQLSDLRDSGAVEQDADNVLLLWRPEYYFDDDTPDEARAKWQGMAELILAKQRDGETGAIKMSWEGAHLRFTELERDRGAA